MQDENNGKETEPNNNNLSPSGVQAQQPQPEATISGFDAAVVRFMRVHV